MTTAAARAVSLAVLLLACAPLTSLYALFSPENGLAYGPFLYLPYDFLAHPTKEKSPATNDQGNGRAPTFKYISTLHAIFQDPNSTLDEMWAALFRESQESTIMLASLRTMQVHHCSILLPWCISLLLGVIIPFMLSLIEFLRPEEFLEDDDEDDYPWASRYNRRRERRMKVLTAKTKNYRKILEGNDISSEDCDDAGVQQWKLPCPGEQNTEIASRSVDGTCAVCLGMYLCGDEVLWSSNPNCPHVYHEDCILAWLVRRRKQCPCCRQPFLAKIKK